MRDKPIKSLSLEEALDTDDDLLDQIRNIQNQLGDKSRKDRSGRKISAEEYSAWRNKAKYALRMLEGKRKKLRRRINELRTLEVAVVARIDPNDPRMIVRGLYELSKDAVFDPEFNFTQQDQAVLDIAREFLTHGESK